jgi:hypothetical protein
VRTGNFAFVPEGDICSAEKKSYSITSSAMASSVGGTQAERLSGFKIDYQFELGRLFDRQFRRIGPFENLV